MKRHTHGVTYTWSDIHRQRHREHAHEGNIAERRHTHGRRKTEDV